MVRRIDIQENILNGQRALVTGANSGIGKAIALSLADAGARVVVNYLHGDDKAEEIVEEIRNKGGEALALKADVSKENEVRSMFKNMYDAFGSIDILVNNAGLRKDAPVHKMSLEEMKTPKVISLRENVSSKGGF
ncbi:MAG: SDR family NAD(P)-dependent oxidoreductase [Deltaproteobacteria bacterium]|nr:SDR family NAD(P)-dependent oxidoreductase [Deltaproteobacteria bacterium]